MLISWTPSLGQTGSDTVKCYTLSELKQIATGLVQYKSCAKQLEYANQMIINRGYDIDIKNVQIINLNKQLGLKDNIISIKDQDLDIVSRQLKIAELKNKHSKLGFTLMSGIASTLLIYTILTH
jgi:hypothetical protein